MHIAHLPPCFKGLMQLKGEKKEVIVTDKYQHTPKPSGQKNSCLNNDSSLHLGITTTGYLRGRLGENGNKMLLYSILGVQFLVELLHTPISLHLVFQPNAL